MPPPTLSFAFYHARPRTTPPNRSSFAQHNCVSRSFLRARNALQKEKEGGKYSAPLHPSNARTSVYSSTARSSAVAATFQRCLSLEHKYRKHQFFIPFRLLGGHQGGNSSLCTISYSPLNPHSSPRAARTHLHRFSTSTHIASDVLSAVHLYIAPTGSSSTHANRILTGDCAAHGAAPSCLPLLHASSYALPAPSGHNLPVRNRIRLTFIPGERPHLRRSRPPRRAQPRRVSSSSAAPHARPSSSPSVAHS